MKYDIITFGSATRDVFLRSSQFKTTACRDFITGKGICLPLGSKIDVEELSFSSGGGGTNTASSFAAQGFKTAFCGMTGKDLAGELIIKELKELGIDTGFILQAGKRPTDYSVILSAGSRERTILVSRGASTEMGRKDIPWTKLKTKWFYLAPLSGKFSLLTLGLVDFAKKNKIKVAFNPGLCQLSMPKEKLKAVLKKIDILILNKEEASFLTKIPYRREGEIFRKIDGLCPGVAVMTKGREGAVVSDGKYLYKAKALPIKPLDITGAGDSFGSGFVSGFIQSKGSIEKAIQLGMANSAANLLEIGAKSGILEKGEKWQKVKVEKEPC